MPESKLRLYLQNTPLKEQDEATIAHLAALEVIDKSYPQIAAAIKKELMDQRSCLKLIASENYSSMAVQLAMGNWLTDKYAEGYVHHRFYAGCENIDQVEEEANKQALHLFDADHCYVQPHSGADANLIAFWSILVQYVQNPYLVKANKTLDALTKEEHEELRLKMMSQKMMGMSLNSGGHLTHGYRHNLSAKMMQAITYDVDPKTGLLDYSAIEKQALQEKPLILMAGYSAYPRRINFAKMREIADRCKAILLVDMAHFAGLVAGHVMTGEENPIPYAQIVTSTTHKTLRGPRGGLILCQREFAEMIDKGCPLAIGGPLPHVMAAKAIAFKEAGTSEFKKYAQNVVTNAQTLAHALMALGVKVATGGTDNHIVLFDVSTFGLTGRQAETLLKQAHITVNRNALPFDPQGPWYTSGIRLGTAALTTLGMGPQEMTQIASLIVSVLKFAEPEFSEKGEKSRAKAKADPKVLNHAAESVKEMLQKFPLYPHLPISA